MYIVQDLLSECSCHRTLPLSPESSQFFESATSQVENEKTFSGRRRNRLSHKGFNGCVWVGTTDIRYVYSDAEMNRLNRRGREEKT